METTTVLDINPQDIGKHIFEMGWYEGEITRIAIHTRTEPSDYGAVGDRTLQFQATLATAEGNRPLDERFDMQGTRAFRAGNILKSLGAKAGTDLALYKGTKIRVQFDKPYEGERGRRNTIVQVAVVE